MDGECRENGSKWFVVEVVEESAEYYVIYRINYTNYKQFILITLRYLHSLGGGVRTRGRTSNNRERTIAPEVQGRKWQRKESLQEVVKPRKESDQEIFLSSCI